MNVDTDLSSIECIILQTRWNSICCKPIIIIVNQLYIESKLEIMLRSHAIHTMEMGGPRLMTLLKNLDYLFRINIVLLRFPFCFSVLKWRPLYDVFLFALGKDMGGPNSIRFFTFLTDIPRSNIIFPVVLKFII